VATEVNQQTNDQQQLRQMLELVETHMGRKPDWVSADTGYWSEPNVTDPAVTGIDLYIAVELVKHGKVIETVSGPPPPRTKRQPRKQCSTNEAPSQATPSRYELCDPRACLQAE
jgi:hypothetical protein